MTLVFPAHAGMSRLRLRLRLLAIGFPRSRGDEPWEARVRRLMSRFSPLTRG